MNIIIAIQTMVQKWCTRQTKWCAPLQKGLENTDSAYSGTKNECQNDCVYVTKKLKSCSAISLALFKFH